MNTNTNDSERYVPDLLGNKEDPSPMAFNLCFLTVKEQEETEYYESLMVKGSDKIRVRANYSEAFRRGVVSIENCVVNGVSIKTPEEFLLVRRSPKLRAFMQDVALHIKESEELTEEAEKN